MALRQIAPGAAGLADFRNGLRLSPSMYFTYAEQNRTFQSLGVGYPAQRMSQASPSRNKCARLRSAMACFRRWVFRPRSAVGFRRQTRFRGPETVMLSYGYWQRHFGGDRVVVGRNVTVDSRPREIVGVMPQGFRFLDADFDLIVPLAFDRGKLILAGFGFQEIGRLSRE